MARYTRVMIGAVTAVILFVMGGVWISSGQTALGGLTLALGLVRAVVLVRDWFAYAPRGD